MRGVQPGPFLQSRLLRGRQASMGLLLLLPCFYDSIIGHTTSRLTVGTVGADSDGLNLRPRSSVCCKLYSAYSRYYSVAVIVAALAGRSLFVSRQSRLSVVGRSVGRSHGRPKGYIVVLACLLAWRGMRV